MSVTGIFVIVRGIAYATAFVLLWAWVAVLARAYDAHFHLTIPVWLSWLGACLAVLGALLALSCVALFIVRGQGTPAPFDPPRQFVATGPYRWVRNPMYLGAALVLLGSGLVVDSFAICVLAAVFLVIAHAFVVLYEEPSLQQRFGPSYVGYRERVARWMPRHPTGDKPFSP